MRCDHALYENGIFQGMFYIDYIEERMEEYRQSAEKLAYRIESDEIVLYAAVMYDEASSRIIYADLMTLRISCERLKYLNSRLSHNCRLFFCKRRREDL